MATHMRLKLRRSLTNSDATKVKPTSIESANNKHLPCGPTAATTRAPPSDAVPPSNSFLNNNQHQPPSSSKSSSYLVSSDPHSLSKSKSVSYPASSDSSSSLPQSHLNNNNKISVVMEKQRPKKDQVKVQIKQQVSKVVVQQEEEEVEKEVKRLSLSLSSVGGRRKSFCDSKIELKEYFSTVSARIVAVDMPPFMQMHAVSCARRTQDSMEKPSSRILASTLKKEFDGEYGPAWHCIVGTSFGSFVTHSVGGFLYFSLDKKLYFLLFKTTVQKAD